MKQDVEHKTNIHDIAPFFLSLAICWSTIKELGNDYEIDADFTSCNSGMIVPINQETVSTNENFKFGFVEVSWWGWKKRGPYPVRFDGTRCVYLHPQRGWTGVTVREIDEYRSGDWDNRGFQPH